MFQYDEDIIFDKIKKRLLCSRKKQWNFIIRHICQSGKSFLRFYLESKGCSTNKYAMKHFWKIVNKRIWVERARKLKKRYIMYIFNKIYAYWIFESQIKKLPNEIIMRIMKYL